MTAREWVTFVAAVMMILTPTAILAVAVFR